MPTLDQIGDKIFRSQLLQKSLVDTAIASEKKGCEVNEWKNIVCISQLIQALETQVLIQDYTSANTVNLYNQLSRILGFQFVDGHSLDPNAQQTPGVVFIGNQPSPVLNFDRIEFNNATAVSLSPYQAVYYPRFGNNPIVQAYLSDGANGFNPDYGNVPTYEYIIPGDDHSGIANISWLYPIPTTGYISIFGVAPAI